MIALMRNARSFAAGVIVLVAALTSAQDVTGSYNGKISINRAVFRASLLKRYKESGGQVPADVDGFVNQGIQSISNMKLSMRLMANGTGLAITEYLKKPGPTHSNRRSTKLTYKLLKDRIVIYSEEYPKGLHGRFQNHGKTIIFSDKDNSSQDMNGLTLTFTKS